MPATTTNRPVPPTTPKKVLSAIHNLPKRVRSGTFRSQAPARGKENVPPSEQRTPFMRSESHARQPQPPQPRRRPAPLLPTSSTRTHASGLDSPRPRDLRESRVRAAPVANGAGGRWAARNGQIVIKVWVPSTDDVWKVRVPEDVGLAQFRARVAAKVGFDVSFASITAGQLRTVASERAFRAWVAGRVDGEGRNRPLTAHRLVLQ